MTRPMRYLIRMVIFLLVAGLAAGSLTPKMIGAFLTNPYLNGLILAVLVGGIFYTLRQVARLKAEIDWIDGFKRQEKTGVAVPKPPLLAPLATMIETSGQLAFSTTSMRSLVDGIAGRLDERRDYSRYMVGLLVFLGLLGTFWGLLTTISAIGQTIGGLSVTSGNIEDMFETLKTGLEAPLSGMGTAFSSSLFGLAGSLVLGFLDLTLGQAQGRFLGEMEDWLADHTKLAAVRAGSIDEGEGGAYSSALMTQTADAIDALERRMVGSARDSKALTSGLGTLNETLAALQDEMAAQRGALTQIGDAQKQMAQAIEQLAQRPIETNDGERATAHLRNIETAVKALVTAQSETTTELSEEVHASIKRLGRTLAAAMDDKSNTNIKRNENI